MAAAFNSHIMHCCRESHGYGTLQTSANGHGCYWLQKGSLERLDTLVANRFESLRGRGRS